MTRVRRKLAVVLFSSVLACRPGEPAAVAGALITFDKYHTVEEFQDYLEAIVDRHSDIAELTVIGLSRGRRPILAVEINNPETGPAAKNRRSISTAISTGERSSAAKRLSISSTIY